MNATRNRLTFGAALWTALVLAAGASAWSTAGEPAPSLRVLDRSPLVLRGSGFSGGERVRVTVSGSDDTRSLAVRASARGTFTARFRSGLGDRCSALLVRALGASGRSAALKLPQPHCPPALEAP